MSRAPLLVAGLLLSLGAASCGDDVNIGSSEWSGIDTGEDAGSPGSDAGDGSTGSDAAEDELARIAEEMAGAWTSSFLDLELTLHLTYTADRGGTASLECLRGGQECGETDGGTVPFEFIKPGSKYWVVESSATKITGILTLNPITGGAVVFSLDRAKNTLMLGPPALIFVATFTKSDAADSSRSR